MQLRRLAIVIMLGALSLTALTADPAQATPSDAKPANGGAATEPTRGPCHYTPTPDEPAVRPVSLPADPQHTPDHGYASVVMITNLGLIPVVLDKAAAPCTVQSFLHLTKKGFYNLTTCHRLTTYPTLKVLQCGDPSGTGEGGPGYRYADELPTGLPTAPTDPTGARKVYARGVLAMANAGPDTNGSQFFLVFGDSALRPDYTIFGRVTSTGLHTLDRVAAGGVATDDPGAPLDGEPERSTHILLAARLS